MGSVRSDAMRDLLVATLHDRHREIVVGAEGVRHDADDAVHRMRVTCRRTRSMLAACRPLIVDERAGLAVAELRWVGAELGRARDAEVLDARLAELVGGRSATGLTEPLLARLRERVEADREAGRAAGLVALGSPRWHALDALLAGLPDLRLEGALADAPAATVLPGLLERRLARWRKAVRRWRRLVADLGEASDAADEALHDSRKRAKDVRYLAELAVPVTGAQAQAVATRAEAVQDLLGDHQDSIVTRRLLRRLVDEGVAGGDDAFVLGRLHLVEERRAADARRDFWKTWRHLPKDLRR